MTTEEIERSLGYLLQATNNLMLASQAQYATLQDHSRQLDAIREIQEKQAKNLETMTGNLETITFDLGTLATEVRELRNAISDYLRGIRNGN